MERKNELCDGAPDNPANLMLLLILLLLFSIPYSTSVAHSQRMLEPAELLQAPKFKSLYSKALGPKSKTPWLARMDGPAPTTRMAKVGGRNYVLAAFCKNHDYGDNNVEA